MVREGWGRRMTLVTEPKAKTSLIVHLSSTPHPLCAARPTPLCAAHPTPFVLPTHPCRCPPSSLRPRCGTPTRSRSTTCSLRILRWLGTSPGPPLGLLATSPLGPPAPLATPLPLPNPRMRNTHEMTWKSLRKLFSCKHSKMFVCTCVVTCTTRTCTDTHTHTCMFFCVMLRCRDNFSILTNS